MLLESRNMIGEVDFARCEVWRNQWSRIPWLSTAFLRGISLSLFILILHWFLDSNSWEKKLFCVSFHHTALMTACVTVSLKGHLITLCQQNLAISDSDVQFHLWLDWKLSLWSPWTRTRWIWSAGYPTPICKTSPNHQWCVFNLLKVAQSGQMLSLSAQSLFRPALVSRSVEIIKLLKTASLPMGEKK